MSIPPDKVRWKIQTWNHDTQKPRALYVPYFDARDVEDALDDLFGWERWSTKMTFAEIKGVPFCICELTVYPPNGGAAVVKTDAAPLTDIESIKGGVSDSLKRAAAQLGVGRNAYALPSIWATCALRGDADKPQPQMPTGHAAKLTKQALAILGQSDEGGEYEG